MKRFFYSYTFSLICLFAFHFSSAQDFSNKGKEFWISYSYHVGMVQSTGGQPTMTLYLTSDATTTFLVEIFGVTTIQSGTLTAGQVLTVNIPNTYFINNEGVFTGKAIRVTAEKPIVVYSFITRSAASAATLCLPTSVLGKEYYSSNFTQISNENNSNSYFTIIAVEDNTTVEITPTAVTKNGWAAGSVNPVTLNKGQIYQVLATTTGNNGGDLTGSRIRSIASGTGGCKKIAVFSGSGKIFIGCTAGGADNLYQQLYPTGTWGKKYLTVPSYSKPNNYFRITRSSSGGNVYLNGSLIPSTSFTNNYYQFVNNQPNLIESDQPVTVSQYFTSQTCNNNTGNYDPDMIVLNPVEQNIDKVTLVSTNLVNAPAQHHIHVIMRNGGTGLTSFKLDGTAFPAASWIVHPADPSYSYLYLSNVSQGYHRLESDSGFNAIAYGYASFESYGYSAGANVKDLYQFASIQNQFSTVNFPSTCKGAPFYLSMTFPYQPTQIKWVFGAALNAMGFTDITNNSPVYDSTWVVNGKQLYRYKLASPYIINSVGTYTIKVLAQNPTPDGCSGEQEISYDVQVFEKPSANFNFTSTGCISDSVRFTDNSNSFGRTPIQWFWDFDDNTSSQVRNPAHLYTAAKSYNVKFSMVTDIGCISDTAEKTILITDPPVAKFGVSAPYCVGKVLTFTDSSTAANSTIVKWTWDFGDGSPLVVSNNGNAQTHTYASTGNYTATLMVENSSGCKSILATRPIQISPNPVVDFVFGNACLPAGNMQFTSQSSIADGSESLFSYLWTFEDGGNATVKDPQHTYTAVGPFLAKLVIRSNAGCTDSISKSVTTIYAQPLARFTSPPEICLGATASFAEQSTASNSTVVQWEWNFGDGSPLSSVQNPSHTYTAAGRYDVTLKITSAAGCVSAIETKSIVVNALPVADFTFSSPACETKTISFASNSTPGAGTINKWTWNFGDGSAPSTLAAPTHVYADTGTYQVTLQVETDKGCVSILKTKPVRINPLPQAGFIVPGNCINDPITVFTDTSSISDGSEGQFSWLWNFGDGNATPANNTSTSQNGQHRYTATGSYTVTLTVTSKDGCSAIATEVFTLNGAVPVPSFDIQNGPQHCSNDSVAITDNSTVAPGKLVKLEIYWDYSGDPTQKTVVNSPVQGTTYKHLYPEFFTPATKTYQVKFITYSGLNCLTVKDTTITMKATPDIVFNTLAASCADQPSFQLAASAPNLTGNGIFSGKGVNSAGVFSPSAAGAGTHTIRYTYTANNGCSNYKEQSIVVYSVPTVSAGPDKFILDGGAATLNGTASGNSLVYIWSPAKDLSDPTVLQPITTPKDDVTYTLTVTSSDGCSASDDVFVKLLKAPTIPNVFSPNGDGVNDKWNIQYLESYPGATVELYNSYGQVVFRSTGYLKAWDGTYNAKPVPAGTYYYIINPKNGRKQISGFVDVVR